MIMTSCEYSSLKDFIIENTSSVWIPLDNARYVLSWIAAPSPMFAECPSPHSIISAPDSAIDLNISKETSFDGSPPTV